jgi:hypothetical protein
VQPSSFVRKTRLLVIGSNAICNLTQQSLCILQHEGSLPTKSASAAHNLANQFDGRAPAAGKFWRPVSAYRSVMGLWRGTKAFINAQAVR